MARRSSGRGEPRYSDCRRQRSPAGGDDRGDAAGRARRRVTGPRAEQARSGKPAAFGVRSNRWRSVGAASAIAAVMVAAAASPRLVAYYGAKLPPTSRMDAAEAAGERAHPRRQRRADHQSRRHRRREPHARRDAALPARGGDRDRGPPLLLAFRHRPDRPRPRAGRQLPRRRRRPGRLDAHPAARQEPLPHARAHLRAEDPGGDPRGLARGAA